MSQPLSFDEVLKLIPTFGLSSSPMVHGEPLLLDLRAPQALSIGGVQCGLASAPVAVLAVAGADSHRMLIAVGKMLADLVQSPPEEIADRMRELASSLERIAPHINSTTAAIKAEISRAASVPEWKGLVH